MRTPSPTVAVAAGLIGVALVLALIGALSGRGPAPSPSAAPSAIATATGSPSPSPAASPSASPSPSPSPSAAPTPAPTPLPTTGALPQVRLVRAFGPLAFAQMTGLFQGPDGRWFVLEQEGRILTFREGDAQATVFLDLTGVVEAGGEEGLLGFALAPDFARSGVFFVDYTAPSPRRTIIASFTSSGAVADPASRLVILEIGQPYANHNGGQLGFGPDGKLYIAMGDGGSGGDPQGNGQNTGVLLGKILRIDVGDRTRAGIDAYQIPPDNPFASGGGRGEIWAYGLRNPWRFSFDGTTLWVGDVGQGAWEEVDIVTRGGNYGWNVMEGAHCYGATSCDRTGLVLPVAEYDHSQGCSISGGFVYRGRAIPTLAGAYLYSDFCSGRVWALRYQNGAVTEPTQVARAGFGVSSFARDNAGELYVLEYSGSGGIYRIGLAP